MSGVRACVQLFDDVTFCYLKLKLHHDFIESSSLDYVRSHQLITPPRTMTSTKHRTSVTGSTTQDGDMGPLQNNPLQSDFTADDTGSMDSDERYLVRLEWS